MTAATARPQKAAAGQPSVQISSSSDILNGLRSENVELVTRTLTTLRNQFNLKPDTRVESDDKRLLLIQEWLQRDEEMYSVFEIWDQADKGRQIPVISLALSVISATLNLLSTHYTYQALGHAIVRSLLSSSNAYSTRISNYLGGSFPADVLLSTLKLWNSLSNFASGRERKTVLAIFPWEQKSLSKLLNMRRKSEKTDHPLAKPDIRTLWILFLLSFVDSTSASSLKTSFLQTHFQKLQAVFKGISQDPYAVVRRTLEVCWAGIWEDRRLPRTSKITLFTDITILQACLVKLYERKTSEGIEEEIAADLVHHFLLAICTRPGTGVCFANRGWYPRSSSEYLDNEEEEGQEGRQGRARIYNHILANVLKGLRPNADERQQELVLKILKAAPELVAGFWHAANLTLDPRLSSRWIDNIALVGHVVSLPVPLETFRQAPENTSSPPADRQYLPSPPPLSSIVDSILPSTINTRVMFTKGLQSNSRLVQHCMSLALSKTLEKYIAIRKAFSDISTSLGELPTDQNGWKERILDAEKDLRKRAPEFSVILAYTMASETSPMLMESAMRLLRLYSSALPGVVKETRFDAGKLLLKAFKPNDQNPWTSIIQLHVLRVIEANIEQFDWSSKADKQSYLAFMLHAYLSHATSNPVRNAMRRFLVILLSDSPLFEDSTLDTEVDFWIECLPMSHRKPVEGNRLTDERQGVIDFLDDCIQRYLKTPHKYREQLEALEGQGSPLLMTVLEQLQVKIDRQLLSSSDILALATYLRMLLFRLSPMMEGNFPETIANALTSSLSRVNLADEDIQVTRAISKERRFIGMCMHSSMSNSTKDTSTIRSDVPEELEVPAADLGPEERLLRAYGLVDWLRLAEGTVTPVVGRELFSRVKVLHRHAAYAFLWHVSGEALWEIVINDPDAINYCSPDWLLFCTPSDLLASDPVQNGLLECTKAHVSSNRLLRNVASLLVRRLTGVDRDMDTALLILLSSVAKSLEQKEWRRNIVHLPNFLLLSMQNAMDEDVSQAFKMVVECCLSPKDEEDCIAVQPISNYWFDILSLWPTSSFVGSTSTIILWIPFFVNAQLQEAMHLLAKHLQHFPDDIAAVQVLSALLPETTGRADIRLPLDSLLSLRRTLGGTLLDKAIAQSMEHCVPRGLLPIICRGQTLESELRNDIKTTIQVLRSTPLPNVKEFLEDAQCLESTIDIVQRTMSVCQDARKDFIAWSLSMDEGQWLDHAFAKRHGCLLAMYLNMEGCTDSSALQEHVMHFLPALFQARATEALSSIYSAVPRENAVAAFVTQLQDANFSAELLELCLRIGDDAMLDVVIEKGLLWAVHELGDRQVNTNILLKLTSAINSSSNVKTHMAETVLTAAIRNHLSAPAMLEFLTVLVRKSNIKPVSVNRYLLMLGQHPGLSKMARRPVVQLLYHLFLTHPSNTCQIAHVEPLIGLYRGTMSVEDRMLLHIFQLFEKERKLSAGSILSTWSGNGGTSHGAVEAVLSLEPLHVLHACSNFPDDVTYPKSMTLEDTSSITDTVIDPIFILLLTSQAISVGIGGSAVEFLRVGTIGLAIRALSAFDESVRHLALEVLGKLWNALQEESIRLQEGTEVVHILSLLRNTISAAFETPRLPCYTSLVMVHALRTIMFPATPIYPIISRFLLQRPVLDMTDVPMLLSMLYGSGEFSKHEKFWMLAFLHDGMQTYQDWIVFHRRHSWDLLAGMFEGTADTTVKIQVLHILQAIVKIKEGARTLIHKHGLLTWIEVQLAQNSDASLISLWLDILLHAAMLLSTETNSNIFCITLVRCISSAIGCSCSNVLYLQHATDILLWMPHIIDLSLVLQSLLFNSKSFEHSFQLMGIQGTDFHTWSTMIQNMWKVAMHQADLPADVFTALTSRMLLLHGLKERSEILVWIAAEVRLLM